MVDFHEETASEEQYQLRRQVGQVVDFGETPLKAISGSDEIDAEYS